MTANLTTRLGQLTSTPAGGPYVGKNRIINGNMAIDQRNAGATVVPAVSAYTLDRWYLLLTQASKITIGQNYGGVTPPVGFSNYLGAKITTAHASGAGDYATIYQAVEGFNIADLNWGTANAKTVTLSAWVYSSVTGTFGGAFTVGGTRSYPFTYSIPVANTWTYITITVAGDTGGSYNTTNGTGTIIVFSYGVGSTFSGTAGAWAGANYLSATGANDITNTLNATFYITGVQLEAGTIATPYEFNQYQVQLAQCQRYYYRVTANSTAVVTPFIGYVEASTSASLGGGQHPVTMRGDPTMVFSSVSFYSPIGTGAFSSIGANRSSTTTLSVYVNLTGSVTIGTGCALYFSSGGYISLSAEL